MAKICKICNREYFTTSEKVPLCISCRYNDNFVIALSEIKKKYRITEKELDETKLTKCVIIGRKIYIKKEIIDLARKKYGDNVDLNNITKNTPIKPSSIPVNHQERFEQIKTNLELLIEKTASDIDYKINEDITKLIKKYSQDYIDIFTAVNNIYHACNHDITIMRLAKLKKSNVDNVLQIILGDNCEHFLDSKLYQDMIKLDKKYLDARLPINIFNISFSEEINNFIELNLDKIYDAIENHGKLNKIINYISSIVDNNVIKGKNIPSSDIITDFIQNENYDWQNVILYLDSISKIKKRSILVDMYLEKQNINDVDTSILCKAYYHDITQNYIRHNVNFFDNFNLMMSHVSSVIEKQNEPLKITSKATVSIRKKNIEDIINAYNLPLRNNDYKIYGAKIVRSYIYNYDYSLYEARKEIVNLCHKLKYVYE